MSDSHAPHDASKGASPEPSHEASPADRKKRAARRRYAIYITVAIVGALFWAFWLHTPSRENALDVGNAGSSEVAALEVRLESHVETLAGAIGRRFPHRSSTSMQRSARYIRDTWEAQGHSVEAHSYRLANFVDVDNVVVKIPGSDPALPILVVGAHYDTTSGTPGADDNASGVALLLELGRALRGATPARTIQLVAFPCEEPPYFKTDEMGSLVYARKLVADGVDVYFMISLESLGYYTEAEGSQDLPAVLRRLYPDRGNFVAVVGGMAHRAWVTRVSELLIEHTTVPIQSGSIPAFIQGVDWSDHWSFWQIGVPAVMLSDTATFRNPNYHQAGDLPSTLDYAVMSRISEGLPKVILNLAQ